jgi:O-antigen/teichoic acid export membrane protein
MLVGRARTPPRELVRVATPGRPAGGEHERHLAISAIAQQVSQVVAVLSMLAAITVLARRLSLPEFGTYSLLVSLTAYVLFAQASVETAAVKSIAEAVDQHARDRAFSTALSVYTLAGLVAGVVIAGVGWAVIGLLGIPSALDHEARISVLALGTITAVGWPFKVFHDVLRGSQLFVASATAESIAVLIVGAALVSLALTDAALWVLVAVGASAPLVTGAVSAVVVRLRRLPYRFRTEAVTLAETRGFLGISVYLFFTGMAELVIYSLDRIVLAGFRSASAVGLYEGPVRAHNLVLQVQSALATPVVSASARYSALGDVGRIRELLLRGTRYMLAGVVPLVLVLTILAEPILRVWLGPKFAVAGTAMSILVGYWLINVGLSVAARMLIATGRARSVAMYTAGVAAVNLILSLALTPSLGLNGVVLGTTLAYLIGFPFFIRLTLSAFPVRLGELAREAWLPAYLTGAVVATGLLAVRLSITLDSLASVAGLGVVAILTYWAIYYCVWLRPGERALVKSVARAALSR